MGEFSRGLMPPPVFATDTQEPDYGIEALLANALALRRWRGPQKISAEYFKTTLAKQWLMFYATANSLYQKYQKKQEITH